MPIQSGGHIPAVPTMLTGLAVTKSLPNLPEDMIIAIMTFCDWKSVLAMRRVCTLGNELSREWVVWNAQMSFVNAVDRPTLRHFSKPRNKYSLEELENLIMGHIKARMVVQGHPYPGIHEKHIRKASTTDKCVQMHCGGRWLFEYSPNAGVMFYDTDDPAAIPQTLVTDQSLVSTLSEYQLQYEAPLDASHASTLYLRMAYLDNDKWVVKIWRVLEAHDSIIGTTLTITPLTSINLPFSGRYGSIVTDVSESSVALSIQHQSSARSIYTCLITWNRTDDTGGLVNYWRLVKSDVIISFRSGALHDMSNTVTPQHVMVQKMVLMPNDPNCVLIPTSSGIYVEDYTAVHLERLWSESATANAEKYAQKIVRHKASPETNDEHTYISSTIYLCPQSYIKDICTFRAVTVQGGKVLGLQMELRRKSNATHVSDYEVHKRSVQCLGLLPAFGDIFRIVTLGYANLVTQLIHGENDSNKLYFLDWSQFWESDEDNTDSLRFREHVVPRDSRIFAMDFDMGAMIQLSSDISPTYTILDFGCWRSSHETSAKELFGGSVGTYSTDIPPGLTFQDTLQT